MAKEVKVVVKLDLRQAKAQATELGKVLSDALNKSLSRGANVELKKLQATLKKLRDDQRALKIKLDTSAARQELVKLQAALKKATAAGDTTEVTRLNAAIKQLRSSIGKLEASERRLEDAEKDLAKAQRNTAKASELLSKKSLTSAARARIATAAIGFLVVAAASLQKVFVSTAKAAIEYESGLIRVAKTTEGVIDDSHELTEFGRALSAEFLALSRVIPIAIEELLTIGEIAGQLGIASGELARFTNLVGALSRTTDLSVEQAATSFAKLGTVLGLTTEEMEDLADSVVYLGNNFPTTETAILKFSQRIAGAAAVANLTASAVAGIATAFLAVGGTPQASATAVQKSIFAIGTAVASGNEKLTIFARLAGQSTEEFSELWRTDAAAAFTAFVDGLGKEGDRAVETLSSLGLGDQRLIRSFVALASAEGLLEDAIKSSAEAFEEGTAANDEAAAQFSTTEASIQGMKNAWEELQVSLVNTVGFKQATQAVTGFLNKVSDAAQVSEEFGIITQEFEEVTGIDATGGAINSLTAATQLTDYQTEALRIERRVEFAYSLADNDAGNAQRDEILAEVAEEEKQLQLAFAGAKLAFEDDAIAPDVGSLIAFKTALELARDGVEFNQASLDAASESVANYAKAHADGGKVTLNSVNAGIVAFNQQRQSTISVTEQLANMGDTTREVAVDIDEVAAAAKRLVESNDAVRDSTLEVAGALLDSGDVAGQMALELLASTAATEGVTTGLVDILAASGLYNESQLEVISNTAILTQAQQDLQGEVEDMTLTSAEADAIFREMAEGMTLTVEASRDLEAEQSALAASVAASVSGMLDLDSTIGTLTDSLIESAVRAGATALDILQLAAASGQLSAAEEDAAVKTFLLAQKQQELDFAISETGLSLADAQAELLQYAANLGLAADEMTRLTDVSSDYEGSLQEVIGSTRGAGSAAKDTEQSFRDLFVGVVNGVEDFEDMDNSAEAWTDSLFDMSIAAGASIEQILGLGLATGKLDEEMASTLLNMAVAQRGVEQIADEYVSGAINADQAAAAIGTLTEQIEAGAKIDLSQFGISAADLAEKGKEVESAAGGATRAVKTWKDELRELASSEGLSASQFAEFAAATTDATDAQVAAALVTDTVSRALQGSAEQISAGLSPEQAIEDISNLEAALASLSKDDLVTFLDGISDIDLSLNTEQFTESLAVFQDTGEVVIPVSAQLELDALQTIKGVVESQTAEIEVELLDPFADGESFNQALRTIEVDADVTAMEEGVDEVADAEYIAVVDADIVAMKEAIDEVTTDATYTTDVEPEIDSSGIQAQLDALKLSVTVDVDVNEVPGGANTPASGDGENPGGGGFGAGGTISGPPHSSGGVNINAEGGEYVVRKSAVNAKTLRLLRKINASGGNLSAVARSLGGYPRFADGGVVGGSSMPIDSVGRSLGPQSATTVSSSVENVTTTDQSVVTTTTNNYYYGNGGRSVGNEVVGDGDYL